MHHGSNYDLDEVLDMKWYRSQYAQEYFNSVFHKGQRRQFGLLERPSLPPATESQVLDYKIFVCGRSGVGKTCTVAKLAGLIGHSDTSETAGIETTTIYWPVLLKATGKVMFFRLSFWDVGDNAIKKFEHILPACQAGVDAYVVVFSFSDHSSFADVPHLIGRMSDGDPNARSAGSPVHVVLGTKSDLYIQDVSDKEIRDLSQRWNVPVFSLRSSSDADSLAMQIGKVAPIINTLCGKLWLRDSVKSQRS